MNAQSRHQAHANIVVPDYNHVPPALLPLTDLQIWCVSTLDVLPDGTLDKSPRQPWNLKRAKTNDPETWGTFDQARDTYEAGRCRAIGFNLLGHPYGLIDPDGVRNPMTGQTEQWAMNIAHLAQSYTELSISGRGLHIIGLHSEGSPIDVQKLPLPPEEGSGTLDAWRGCARYCITTFQPLTGYDLPLANIDRTMNRVVKTLEDIKREQDKKRAKGEKPKGDPKSTVFNKFTQEEIDDLVARGAGAGRDRSGLFFEVCRWYFNLNWTVDALVTLFERHPFGIASKYDGRLRAEVERVYAKLGELPKGAESAPEKSQDRITLAFQGQLLPTIRDRLEIAPSLSPASKFPTEHLPPIVRDMVQAVAHHTQAPESLCAHSVLSAATLVAQPLANVRIAGQGGSVPLSLYFLAVAESGERKTSCDRLATKAVAAHEAHLKEEYETERKRFEAEKHNHDAELKKIKADKTLGSQDRLARLSFLHEPKEPRAPVLRVREPTLEGLINLLKRGRPSVGIFSSEGGSFVGSHGMNDEAKTRTITGLSMLWDDGAFDRVRVNETTIIKGKRVAVSLAVQPRIAAKLLGDELARNQGFLGRFLVLMPESTIGTRVVRETDPDNDARINAFAERAAFLLREGEDCADEIQPGAIEMDDAAKDLHRAFAQGVEDELGKGKLYYPIQALAQRMAEHVARIAGVLHVFNLKIAADLMPGDTMAAACEVGHFYLAEALRIGSGTVIDPEKIAAKDLADWIAGREGGLISPSIAQRLAPRSLRADATTMQKRFATLCAAGVLELIGPSEIDGKPYREVYRLVREQVTAEAA